MGKAMNKPAAVTKKDKKKANKKALTDKDKATRLQWQADRDYNESFGIPLSEIGSFHEHLTCLNVR
jgi:hypothetical protein